MNKLSQLEKYFVGKRFSNNFTLDNATYYFRVWKITEYKNYYEFHLEYSHKPFAGEELKNKHPVFSYIQNICTNYFECDVLFNKTFKSKKTNLIDMTLRMQLSLHNTTIMLEKANKLLNFER